MTQHVVTLVLLVSAMGCVEVPVPVDKPDKASSLVAVDTLRSGSLGAGTMTVGPLRMTTGLAPDRLTAFAQDPVTGSGIELLAGAPLDGWPPAIGTSFKVRGFFAGASDAPVVWVSSTDDVTLLGDVAPPRVLDGADGPPSLSLARWAQVDVLTDPDPAGRASLSVRRSSDGRFGSFIPAAGNTGALTGILLPDGSIAPRSAEDWVGTTNPGVVVPATFGQIQAGAFEVGTTVSVTAIQIAPWSIGGRYTVLQDPEGLGLWVDAEGWSPWPVSQGAPGTFIGQVQVMGGAWILRSWTAPTYLGGPTVAATFSTEPAQGALLVLTAIGLHDPDLRGERALANGVLLDDRFFPLDAIQEGWRVSGVVDLSEGDDRLAVLNAVAPASDTDTPSETISP